jgi:hypothetical protein
MDEPQAGKPRRFQLSVRTCLLLTPLISGWLYVNVVLFTAFFYPNDSKGGSPLWLIVWPLDSAIICFVGAYLSTAMFRKHVGAIRIFAFPLSLVTIFGLLASVAYAALLAYLLCTYKS